MSKRVLLLEDDLDLLQTYEEVISRLFDCETVSFTNVPQLRDQADLALKCDVAFLDINLGPQLESGLKAFQWLQEIGFPGKIFFITGHALSHPLIAQACASAQAKVYQKPLDIDLMSKLILE